VLIVGVALALEPAPKPKVEWLANAGAQIDAEGHGDVNLGVRSGDWTFVLRTDAPELTWGPSGERSRGWITARGHGFAAQMFISPWKDGAPTTGSFNLASAGIEGGWIGYGPASVYFGARGSFDGLFPYGEAVSGVPRAVGTVDLLVGRWTPALRGWVRAGVDVATTDGDAIRSPHVHGEVVWLPDPQVGSVVIGPRVEVRAGAAEGQDDLLRSRLGGLNPWVVPLAGAAWAEWWVEDYAAARLGGTVGLGQAGAKQLGFRVSPFADVATFDGDAAVGLGVGARAWRGRLYADVTGGYAPWIQRQPGITRASIWFSLGWDWGTAAGPSEKDPPGPGEWP
jgi:hypothetical protein